MARKFQVKRGKKANMPVMAEAEFAFAADEGNVYIGSSTGNILVGGKSIPTKTEMNNAIASAIGAALEASY